MQQEPTTTRHQALRRSRLVSLAVGAVGTAMAAGLLPAPAQASVAPLPPRRIVTGWMPYWATASSASSVLSNADLFTDVSPFWYSAQRAGSSSVLAQQVSDSAKSTYLPRLRSSGVKVLPTITDGMGTRQMAATLAGTSTRALLVRQIVGLVTANGYDGIDLDFEHFAFGDGRASWPTTRPAWVLFVSQLSRALHAQGKMLALTTPPIYDASRSASSGYWVYDWAGIAPYVDRLRIMAYDYSVSVPGPIAPFPWVERVVAFATTQVPSGKIQIGIASYGRDWVRRDANNKYLVRGLCPIDNQPSYASRSFTSSSLASVLVSHGLTTRNVVWHPTYLEQTFVYPMRYSGHTTSGAATSCTVYHSVWYDDARAAAARATLVAKYHLAGLAQWTVGGEDPRQWSALRRYARTIAPRPTVVRVSASPVVTFAGRASVAAVATSSGAAVEGATATLYVRQHGKAAWTRVGATTTSVAGVARFAPAVSRYVDYLVAVNGSFERTSGGAVATTKVRTLMSVVTGAPVITRGKGLKVVVTLKPATAGQIVLRQAYSRGAWRTVATARVDGNGRAAFAYRSYVVGKVSNRLVAVGTLRVLGTVGQFSVRVV